MVRILVPLLLLTSLAACSPPHEPIAALALVDGRPTGVLVTCDDRFSQLSVFRNDGDPAATSRPHLSWRIAGATSGEVVEAELLGEPPAGWAVAEPGQATTLTELEPGVRYGLSASGGRKSLPVDFTLADVEALGPDEVLTGNDDWETERMSRDAFVRGARGHCD